MKRLQRAVALLGAAGLAAAGMIGLGQPAGANHVACGSVITQSVTLDSNLNCPGNGLIVQASNITVDLGGRTLRGRTDTNTTPNEFVGIRLMNVTGVTVRNGTITNFDAGVAIGRGSGNTITGLRLHGNINHSTLTGTLNPCDFGDGIVAFDSDNNVIRNNRATHNGPYGGITLVGDSDGNLVSANVASTQDVDNAHPNFVTEQRPFGNGPCGPFVPTAGDVGAVRQGIGIRVEGPGADNNRVEGNQATANDAFGITIHGYICHPAQGTQQQPQPNNGNNVIARNNVVGNGFRAQLGGAPTRGDGISIPSQGPDVVVCTAHSNSVLQNTVTGNARHGIALGHRGPLNTTINGNIVRNNGAAGPGDGINIGGPSTAPPPGCGEVFTHPCPGGLNNTLRGNIGSRNSEHDGHDGNPGCDNNLWRNNSFGTVFRGCERNG
ncbi:MAG TPA: NosD domain-containing protein [Acidimicrobiales bacterium]|nr:NosD domain-containing protein [Acidimicrobiales bacterium]